MNIDSDITMLADN
jgi:hypothetical protein